MSLVATFIDELREVFGSEEINAQVKLGMHGRAEVSRGRERHRGRSHFDEPVKFITADKIVIRDKESIPMQKRK